MTRPALTVLLCGLAVAAATPLWAQTDSEDPQRLLALVAKHVLGNAADAGQSLDAPTLTDRLQLPRCPTTPDVFDAPGSRSGSRRTVGLRCPDGWTIYVPVRVTQSVPMVVLTQPVGPGAVLSAEHLTLEPRPLDSMPLGYIADPQSVIGAIIRQPLAEGTALRMTHVRAGNAVTRGQTVRLIVERDGLRIESRGEALADAALGQWVRARNIGSGRTVEGLVSAPGVLVIP